MATSTKSVFSPMVATTLWVATPLVLGVVFARFANVELEVQTVFYAVGIIVAIGALYWRLRTSGEGMELDPLLAHLVADRFDEALVEAESLGLATDGLRNNINAAKLGARETLDHATNQRQSLETIGMELTSLSEALTQQLTSLEDVDRAADANLETHRRTHDNVEALANSAEESSSSIIQMVTINNEVRESIHNLTSSVEGTTTAIEEMAFSSKEVAKNIEELSTAAEETAASMNEMDVSISQVETNANETSKLSEQVTADAETGVSAINHTIRGIDKIKESSRVAADVISNLGQKIDQIGDILNVIDDVAEQTNLLALNAAIIAAQAGEHGRGFAVVADEIKALAERTGASTKEIAGLIKAIQDESRRAVEVMSRGVEDVEEGVRLGHNAEDALIKIVESAKRSTLMIQAIAQATVEQAKGSKQVTNAISRIAETVQQIAYATAEQAKGAEHIMQSAERMKVITQQVERSAEEQNRGGQQVTQAIETIRELADGIGGAQEDQLNSNKHVAGGLDSARAAADRSLGAGRNLERLLGELVAEVGPAAGRALD